MSIDFTKPIQTRDGRPVRILCTDRAGGMYPVIGLVSDGRNETTHCWTKKGVEVVGSNSTHDLVNVPPPKRKVKVQVHLRMDSNGDVFALAKLPEEVDTWTSKVVASTTVELEYQP